MRLNSKEATMFIWGMLVIRCYDHLPAGTFDTIGFLEIISMLVVLFSGVYWFCWVLYLFFQNWENKK